MQYVTNFAKTIEDFWLTKKNKHVVSVQLKCVVCGEICRNEKSLNAHTRIRHKNIYRSKIIKDFVPDEIKAADVAVTAEISQDKFLLSKLQI